MSARCPAVASLCAGYGGLDLAVRELLGGADLAWYAQYEPPSGKGKVDVHQYAARIMAHHWPGVPNLGDITRADWKDTEPVDVLTAGFPCTDISDAGPRTGITGTRSGIWSNVADAVSVLRPSLVLLENVAAIRGRGLDTVVRDLALTGYAVRWTCVPASDIGAPHRRLRWFAAAVPVSEGPLPGWDNVRKPLPAHGEFTGGAVRVRKPAEPAEPAEQVLLKTPTSNLGTNGGSQHPDKRRAGGHGPTLDDEVAYLPTPVARDWRSAGDTREGRTNGLPLNEVVALLPTPKASDGPNGGPNQRDAAGNWYLPARAVRLDAGWTCADGRDFGPAVRRWEKILGRGAPEPADTGPRGGRRVTPAFVEWMMGLPEGHVTSLDIPRADQLKALGNGVVPQQALHAYRSMVSDRLIARTRAAGRAA